MADQADPLLVRLGIRYFRSLSSKNGLTSGGSEAIDAVHVLNAEERKALRRIQRGAVLRAALAGAISSVITAAIEVSIARPLLGPRPRLASFSDQLRFYAVVGVATVVSSVIEILFVYWDGLRSVHALSREAGLDLFPNQEDERALAAVMARAALELPNPTTHLFGVDPRREASRLRLVLASLVYKLKVSLSNFVIKALVRRTLGRAFVRGWLPFVAVPITAAWNAIVCWLIMREARIRAMGPSAVREMLDIVFADDPRLSPEAKAALVRAVASAIVRTQDLHPNLAALLQDLVRRVDIPEIDDLDDSRAFLACLAALRPDERTIVLRVLSIASIIDGRLTRPERRLLLEARKACGLTPDLRSVEELRRAFAAGDPIGADRL